MTTILYTHASGLRHDTGAGHPERADRLRAIERALAAPHFGLLDRREPEPVDLAEIIRVHDQAYVEGVMAAIPDQGLRHLDGDTVASPGTGEAALRAAGAVCEAVDAVMAGEANTAFCALRPPGHHAEPDQAMGFCVFNNVAVGALRARAVHGLARIAVIDFDVHHGNGTQAVFERDPGLFYTSTHQSPLYPGTGRPHETGVANNILNLPLPPGAGGPEFREAVTSRMIPALDEFAPQLVMISAGFDGHRQDPLANLNLDEADFGWITDQLLVVADRHCDGRVVSTLEGGYNLDALARSVAEHVRRLMRIARH